MRLLNMASTSNQPKNTMKNKAITLFQIRNINTGNLVRERLTKNGVVEVRRCLEGMSVDFDDFLAVECAGLFTAKRVAYTINSMSQADIDAGGDNDPCDLYETVYTPLATN